jgi:hypothetical protein
MAVPNGFAATTSDPSVCPVAITDVRNLDTRIFVVFTNTSGKRLDSYQFGLEFFDENGTSHPYPENFKAIAHVPSRNHFIAYWRSAHTLKFLYPRAHAYLMQASFDDGSTWTDDGSHSCGLTAEEE